MRLCLAISARTLASLLLAAWVAQPVAAALHSNNHGHRYCSQHQVFEAPLVSKDLAGMDVLATKSYSVAEVMAPTSLASAAVLDGPDLTGIESMVFTDHSFAVASVMDSSAHSYMLH